MITVRATFPSGHEIITDINGTLETVTEYYTKNVFNTGYVYYENGEEKELDRLESAVKVEVV